MIFDEREVSFVVGEGEDQGLIIGIETAVKKMKKMETSLITVHPDLAFGREGKQDWNIPSNAQVQYQIQLLDFEKVSVISLFRPYGTINFVKVIGSKIWWSIKLSNLGLLTCLQPLGFSVRPSICFEMC